MPALCHWESVLAILGRDKKNTNKLMKLGDNRCAKFPPSEQLP
jgi:hypothetical protein